MTRNTCSILALITALLLLSAAPALAETYVVTTTADDGSGCETADSCTLRGALANTTDFPGSTITLPAGRYVLTAGQLQVAADATINGASARSTIIDAGEAGRAIRVSAGKDVHLTHLTVTGGRVTGDSGGDIQSLGSLTLDHVRVTNGRADNGGGIASPSGSLTLVRSLVDGNAATGSGGGVLTASGSALNVDSSTFTGNSASAGGGLRVTTAGSTASLRFSTIAGNSAGAGAGGIAADGGAVNARALVLAGNTSNCSGAFASGGANLESGTDCGFTGAGDKQNGRASLQGLADRGGDTDTLALGDDSEARDIVPTADCPSTDQRDSGRPKAGACDAGAFEADPVAPPSSPSTPAEHTIYGFVSALPPYTVGLTSFGQTSPFAVAAPKPLRVSLREDRRVIATQVIDPPSAKAGGDPSQLPYFRFDDLHACGDCTVVLETEDGQAQDLRSVSFAGTAGQDYVPLFAGRVAARGMLEGSVLSTGGAEPQDLSVRVVDAKGTVLADTAKLRPRCVDPKAGSGLGTICPPADTYSYRLTGLPDAPTEGLTAQLLQRPEKGEPFPVDSTPLLGGQDGSFYADALTAVDRTPGRVAGQTVYGSVTFVGPYGPGAIDRGRQSIRFAPGRPTLSVELRDANGRRVDEAAVNDNDADPRSGTLPRESGYRLTNLRPCERCTVQLMDRNAVLDRFRVTVGSARAGVQRADLSLRSAGRAQLLDGSIFAPGFRSDDVRVVITDTKTDAKLADSDREPQSCSREGADKARTSCEHDSFVYRLGDLPARRNVTATLYARGREGKLIPVDSNVFDIAPPGSDTTAPPLMTPYRWDGKPTTRTLTGYVFANGSYAPGAAPAPAPAPKDMTVRLRSADGSIVADAKVSAARGKDSPGTGRPAEPLGEPTFRLSNLPPCADCQLELRADAQTEDRVSPLIPASSPTVGFHPLGFHQLGGGPYVSGGISFRKPVSPTAITVRVSEENGRKIAATADPGVAQGCRRTSASGGRDCAKLDAMQFRLGKMPRVPTTVKVSVLGPGDKVLGSTLVTAGGGLEASVFIEANAPRAR